MSATVAIFFRVVYGNQRIYPANATALKFAQLLDVKTFNDTQLLRMKELGFSILNVRDPEARLFGTEGERLNLAWEATQK